MLKKCVSFSALTFCVGIGTSIATVASGEDFDHALQNLVANPEELTNVLNSHTMAAATQFCQLAVYNAYQKKLLDDKMFVQLNAHCIVGNFHDVGYMLGADFTKDVTSQYNYTGGVIKYLTADEQNAIEVWNKIK